MNDTATTTDAAQIDQDVATRVNLALSSAVPRITEATVAQSLGMSRDSFRRRKSGKYAFTHGELVILSRLLNVPVSTFTNGQAPLEEGDVITFRATSGRPEKAKFSALHRDGEMLGVFPFSDNLGRFSNRLIYISPDRLIRFQ